MHKGLRDKKFSHADNDDFYNDPFSYYRLSKDEIGMGIISLKMILAVINNCTKYFNFSTGYDVPSSDNRIIRFIEDYAQYKKEKNENFIKVLRMGNNAL